MKKLLLLSIIIFYSSIILMAQKPIKLFKETKQLLDGTFQVIEKNKKGDTLVLGLLSSINPDIRNGEFNFFNSDRVLEAKGSYTGDVPSGIWYYFDKQGNIVKTINYDKTIEFLNADTVKIKEVFLIVEQMPYFKVKDSDSFENMDSFRKYIQDNLVYPIYAAKKNISERVYMQFVIAENGKVCKISVIRSSGDLDLNMEAFRILSESPLWEPGKQRNVPVAVSYTFPISFGLK